MSLLKLPLLLSSAICWEVAFQAGQPLSPDSENRIETTSIRERLWRHTALPCCHFMKVTTPLAALAESVVILGSLWDVRSSSSDTVSAVLNALGPREASRTTVSFVLGASLVVAGGIIRFRCYRALGPYFTFAQCVQKGHKLVTTGPYAVVRHPAYTGLFMCLAGSCIMHTMPGAWLRASGVLGVPWVRAAFGGWWMVTVASVVTLFSRPTEEDRLLSERFGKEWEDWAKRVKYRLIPFVY